MYTAWTGIFVLRSYNLFITSELFGCQAKHLTGTIHHSCQVKHLTGTVHHGCRVKHLTGTHPLIFKAK